MKDREFNVLRWAPVGVSMVLVVLIGVISIRTVAELKRATFWREHTFKVILDAQTLEDKLLDAQSGVDHYVAVGTPDLLLEYRNDTNMEQREFSQLSTLTRDNAEQQARLKNLASAVKAVFDYDNRLIAVYGQNGAKAAVQADSSVQERQVLDPAVKDVATFKDTEENLLTRRDTAEQTDYHKAARRLVVASILTAILLVISNYFASREMNRRRRAEAKQLELINELQKSLAQVKTLSGLIPICGWCKKVRSDTGYWQSVEQYVRARTLATFSHGVCPSCAEKWKHDMAKGQEKAEHPTA